MSDFTMDAVSSILGLPAAPSAVPKPIDHVYEAGGLLGGIDWRNGAAAVAQAAEAQVHATLALVEQQRIANLIAYHRAFPRSPRTADAIRVEVERGVGLL